MDFSFSEEQQLLQDTLRRYVADHYGFERRKQIIASADGFSREVWKDFAGLGLLGLNVPAQDGGLGGGAVETLLVAGVLGEALALEPFLSSAVSASHVIATLANPAQRSSLLPALSDGDRLAVLAHPLAPASAGDAPVRATAHGGGWRLQGRIDAVYHAPAADVLLVPAASTPGSNACDAIFVIEAGAPGLTVAPFRSVDAQLAGDVILEGVQADAASRLGGAGAAVSQALAAGVDIAVMALCAETLGVLDKALALTVDYTRTRQQFGGPIGRFQVLQHRMVDMLMRIEMARSLVYLAASRCDGGEPGERESAVSAAKVLVAEAARFVGQQAVQLHGGMGVADESAISHYFKRLLAAEIRCGSAQAHLQRYAASMQE